VRFGGQGGSLAQTIRPTRQKAAGGSVMPDLDLPQGEPMSPPYGNSGGEEDEGEGSGDESQEDLSYPSAGQTGEFFASHCVFNRRW
jgi:hypothetical protein